MTVNEEGATNVATKLRERARPERPRQRARGACTWSARPHCGRGCRTSRRRIWRRPRRTGFPIVALILVAVFGSLIAASCRLRWELVSVLITGAIIYLLSLTMEMSVFVTNMASMIGIGVAVDYSLFVLARYRQEIRAGADPEQGARDRACDLRGGGHLLGGHGCDGARRACIWCTPRRSARWRLARSWW